MVGIILRDHEGRFVRNAYVPPTDPPRQVVTLGDRVFLYRETLNGQHLYTEVSSWALASPETALGLPIR